MVVLCMQIRMCMLTRTHALAHVPTYNILTYMCALTPILVWILIMFSGSTHDDVFVSPSIDVMMNYREQVNN